MRLFIGVLSQLDYYRSQEGAIMKANDKIKEIMVADQQVLFKYGLECYQAGFLDGIKLCNKVLGWLTMQPDTDRQKDQRKWVKNLVVKECEELGIDPPEWLNGWNDSTKE
jgi:hypothetical protein